MMSRTRRVLSTSNRIQSINSLGLLYAQGGSRNSANRTDHGPGIRNTLLLCSSAPSEWETRCARSRTAM